MTPEEIATVTSWKPGPPPLDRPGRFDAVFDDGARRAVTVGMYAADGDVEGDRNTGTRFFYSAARILWHLGPIPDPPSQDPAP